MPAVFSLVVLAQAPNNKESPNQDNPAKAKVSGGTFRARTEMPFITTTFLLNKGLLPIAPRLTISVSLTEVTLHRFIIQG
jgi:hypothetical protein